MSATTSAPRPWPRGPWWVWRCFSSLLGHLLERAHDRVMVVLVGLMVGSLRVLWPWPDGVGVIDSHSEESTSGTALGWPAADEWFWPTALAVVGFTVVMAWSWWADRSRAKES